jgi:hypothetical protein
MGIIRQAGRDLLGTEPNGKRIAAAGGVKKNSSVASWLRSSTAVVRTVFGIDKTSGDAVVLDGA